MVYKTKEPVTSERADVSGWVMDILLPYQAEGRRQKVLRHVGILAAEEIENFVVF